VPRNFRLADNPEITRFGPKTCVADNRHSGSIHKELARSAATNVQESLPTIVRIAMRICPVRLLVVGLVLCPVMLGQQGFLTEPEQMNQRAAAADPAGIRAYSRALIETIVHVTADPYLYPSTIDPATEKLIDSLSYRLANAEQAVRQRKGHLVPESDVVRAFNELMERTGAPYRADEANVHAYRVHAAELKILPALLTEDRNGANCNPGEAVYLISLLMGGNGKLDPAGLDGLVQLRRSMDAVAQGRGFATNSISTVAAIELQGAYRSLYDYYRHHHHNVSPLFNRFATTLGF
jgi:hypothetical protein